MIKIDREHHKIIRTSPAWGDWAYEYHERHQQERKARQWMKGRKKIQDLFTDRKIPRHERDTVLLLARGHEVLLAGDEVSGNCAVSGDSRNLLIIEYTRSYSVPQ